jgi:hypothetical protein
MVGIATQNAMVDRRTAQGWSTRILHGDEELTVPEFGLACPVRDIYRDTPLG